MKKGIYFFIEIWFGLVAISAIFADSSTYSLKDKFSVFIFSIIIMIITYIFNNHNKEQKTNKTTDALINKEELIENKSAVEYVLKSFLSRSEVAFYNKIKELNEEYIVVPQVNLGTIVDKTNGKYRNELFKNIDFGIFDKNFKLLLLIELNDETHNTNIKRKDRDLRVKKILNDCNIKLLTFYTKYPNEKEYVINRIKKSISEINEESYSK